MFNTVTIIMYHYVRDLKQGRFRDIKGLDVELFSGQLDYLLRYYNIISMEELIACVEEKGQLQPKSVVLTFDDGYTDHFDCVLPLLLKHKVQGSFYPPARAILKNEVLDVNKIHFVLASVPDKDKLVKDIFLKLDEYRTQYDLESSESYFATYAIASRYDNATVQFIKKMLQAVLPEKLRLIICNYLFQKYVTADEASFSKELYMSMEQIRELNGQGMHIGSHGYNHFWLGTLSKEKQVAEIDQSLEFLAQTGCDISNWTMCYPYGSYNNDTLEILAERNCKLGLTTKVNLANVADLRKYELHRLDTNDIPVNGNTTPNEWFYKA